MRLNRIICCSLLGCCVLKDFSGSALVAPDAKSSATAPVAGGGTSWIRYAQHSAAKKKAFLGSLVGTEADPSLREAMTTLKVAYATAAKLFDLGGYGCGVPVVGGVPSSYFAVFADDDGGQRG